MFDIALFWQALGGATFALHNASDWRWFHYVLFFFLIYAAFGLLGKVVLLLGNGLGYASNPIKMRGKHYDVFESIDHVWILHNKIVSAFFVHCLLYYCFHSGRVAFGLDQVTVANTVLALPALDVVYDFWYSWSE